MCFITMVLDRDCQSCVFYCNSVRTEIVSLMCFIATVLGQR